MEDGTVGGAASTVVTNANSPVLDGAAGGGAPMLYSSDLPAAAIYDPVSATVYGNSVALYTDNVFVQGVTPGNRVDVDDNTNAPPLHEPAAFSFEMFINATPESNSSVFRVIAAKRRTNGNYAWGLMVANGQLVLRVDSDTGGTGQFNQGVQSNKTTHGVLDDGNWHHIALTYDPTGNDGSPLFRLYKDYVQVATLAPANNGAIVYDGGVMTFGGRPDGNGFSGTLDEVRLSDSVLTSGEFLVATAIPEPGVLVGCLGGLAMIRRRR